MLNTLRTVHYKHIEYLLYAHILCVIGINYLVHIYQYDMTAFLSRPNLLFHVACGIVLSRFIHRVWAACVVKSSAEQKRLNLVIMIFAKRWLAGFITQIHITVCSSPVAVTQIRINWLCSWARCTTCALDKILNFSSSLLNAVFR